MSEPTKPDESDETEEPMTVASAPHHDPLHLAFTACIAEVVKMLPDGLGFSARRPLIGYHIQPNFGPQKGRPATRRLSSTEGCKSSAADDDCLPRGVARFF